MGVSIVQIFFAVACIIVAGAAIQRLLVPRSEAGCWAERAGLWWLIGGGWVSIMIAIQGSFLKGPALVLGVLASIAALTAAALRKKEPTLERTARIDAFQCFLLAIIAFEVLAIAAIASRLSLGWDALMNWEWKARLAFSNGGCLPAGYFGGRDFIWSLPRYPLQLPYVESWLYLCLGRVDQAWVRLIGPLYYLAGVGIIAGACRRLGGSNIAGWCAAAAMFFVPYMTAGAWGLFAGYADLPLGVLLLACVSRVPSLTVNPTMNQARLLGFVAALLPWMKREGQHLWMIVMVLAVIQLYRRQNWRLLPWVAGPGIAMIAAFEISMSLLRAVPYPDTVVLSFQNVGERWSRVGFVANRLLTEMLDFDAWSFLWPGAIAAVVALFFQGKRALGAAIGGGLLLCWLLLGISYVVGFPGNLEGMIALTIDRVVLQFVPLAILAIAVAVPQVSANSETKACL